MFLSIPHIITNLNIKKIITQNFQKLIKKIESFVIQYEKQTK